MGPIEHASTHTHTRTEARRHIHKQTSLTHLVHTRKHTIDTNTHTQITWYKCTHTNFHLHASTHTYTHTHTLTYTRTQSTSRCSSIDVDGTLHHHVVAPPSPSHPQCVSHRSVAFPRPGSVGTELYLSFSDELLQRGDLALSAFQPLIQYCGLAHFHGYNF